MYVNLCMDVCVVYKRMLCDFFEYVWCVGDPVSIGCEYVGIYLYSVFLNFVVLCEYMYISIYLCICVYVYGVCLVCAM